MDKLRIPLLPSVKASSTKVFITGEPYGQAKLKGDTAGPVRWTEAVKKATLTLPKVRGQCHLWVTFVLPANRYPADHPHGPALNHLLKRVLDAMSETVFSDVPGNAGAVAVLVATKRRALGDEATGAEVTIRETRQDSEPPDLPNPD